MPPKYKWDKFLMGWYRCAVFYHVFSFKEKNPIFQINLLNKMDYTSILSV